MVVEVRKIKVRCLGIRNGKKFIKKGKKGVFSRKILFLKFSRRF